MNLSRKDFFKKGLFSLAETVGTAAGMLKSSPAAEPVPEAPDEFVPTERADMLAVADNRHCLAKNCGCFACSDRCEFGAVTVVPGQGIRVDVERCTGCGTCEYVCPVTPKAVFMAPRA